MVDRSFMIKLCKMKDPELRLFLYQRLKEHGYSPIIKKDYIFAEGSLPVCLVAHMDTVFTYIPEEFYFDQEKKVLWSPDGAGFDDRTGIYIILEMLRRNLYPSIIFTEDEECGGLGAKKLVMDNPECPFKDCRAIIEVDRAWERDSVFYQCDNKDFEKYINTFGFETSVGTFTDISIIAPEWKIAAVNLSVGYMNEHTHQELLHCDWTEATIDKLSEILKKSPDMLNYSYIPKVYIRSPKGKKKGYNAFYEGYGVGPTEEDELDDIAYRNCLFCGRSFKNLHRNIINYPDYSYAVCDDCKELYLC